MSLAFQILVIKFALVILQKSHVPVLKGGGLISNKCNKLQLNNTYNVDAILILLADVCLQAVLTCV